VRAHYRKLRDSRATLLTSNLVLAETATQVRFEAGLPAAFKALVEQAEGAGC
jgi:hypothetical protein